MKCKDRRSKGEKYQRKKERKKEKMCMRRIFRTRKRG